MGHPLGNVNEFMLKFTLGQVASGNDGLPQRDSQPAAHKDAHEWLEPWSKDHPDPLLNLVVRQAAYFTDLTDPVDMLMPHSNTRHTRGFPRHGRPG